MADKHSSKLVDVTGQRFGRLTVLGRSDRKSSAGALWACVCDCGGETVTTSLRLRKGHTTSCGCVKRSKISTAKLIHGYAQKRDGTYRSWKEMRQRCNNSNNHKWKWYGGRGITVCERWSDFTLFLADMGQRPVGTSIDRIDSDGNYEPSNCRWATPKQQAETNRGVIRAGATPKNKTPPEVEEAVRRARADGAAVKDIAAQMGLGLWLVYAILQRSRNR